jgi:hypothetical protein
MMGLSLKILHAMGVVSYRNEDQSVAQALMVEGSSFGDTHGEARDAIHEALTLYFDDRESVDIHEAAEARLERVWVG